MLFRLHFVLHSPQQLFVLYSQFLFSFLHFILCRMCVCHMFNKVLTYLLTSVLLIAVEQQVHTATGVGSIVGSRWL